MGGATSNFVIHVALPISSFAILPSQQRKRTIRFGHVSGSGSALDHSRYHGARDEPQRAPGELDARPVRAVLFLGLSSADLSAGMAAGTVSHLRRQYRVGDHR